jgi:hypothetical protein
VASKTRWLGGILAFGFVAWTLMEETESTSDNTPRVRQPEPRRHRRVVLPPPSADQNAGPDKTRITVHLTRSPRLRQQIDLPTTFDPQSLIPMPDEDLLPDTEAAEALQDLLAADGQDRTDAVDEFIDAAFSADGPGPNAANPWSMVVELEAERLAIESDFLAEQAHEMAVLRRISQSGTEANIQALQDLPLVVKRNVDMIEFALEVADTQEDAEVGAIARLYAAQALSDWDSDWFSEHRSQEVLLDALHSTDDPTIIDTTVEMLTPLSATPLAPEDLAILEDSWDVITPELRAPLARFMLDQRYAAGEPAQATAWADRFETELLSGHEWGGDTGNRWWELDEARDRLAADMDTPAADYRAGFDLLARKCWSAQKGVNNASMSGTASMRWSWDGDWSTAGGDTDHSVLGCIADRSDAIPAPDGPTDVELVLRIEGSAG